MNQGWHRNALTATSATLLVWFPLDARSAMAQSGGVACSSCCPSYPGDTASSSSVPAGCNLVIFLGTNEDGTGDPPNCATCTPCTWGISQMAWSCPAGNYALQNCRPAGCAVIGSGPYNRPGRLNTLCDGAPDFLTCNIYNGSSELVYSRTLSLACGCTVG